MESKFFKIGDIFNVEKGLVQSSKNVEGQFDFITASAEWKTHNEYSHDCEALVFAAGAAGSLGRTHYVNGKFIASDLCFVLTPKDNLIDKVDLKFYFYYFNLNKDAIVKNTATGTSKLAINMKNFINYSIPLPSIEYQKLGREKIEKVEPKINELKLIFEKNLTYITKLRQSILQEAVQGKLVPQDPNDEPASVLLEKIKAEKERLIKEGKIKKEKPIPPITEDEIPYELPKGWEWVRLSDVALLERGKSKHRPRNDESLFVNGTYPFVQTGDVANSNVKRVIDCYSKCYNEKGLKQSKLWPKGTLCITIAANIAETGILGFDACFPDSVVGLNPFSPISEVKFFDYFFRVFQKDLVRLAPSTAQKNINLNILNSIIFPLPPLNEQKRIVEKVDQLMALCNELEKNIEESKRYSELLMQSVLQEAFKEA